MLAIKPLSDALGAEITGLDLTRPLDDDTKAKIQDAFLKRHLLCFRSQPLEPAEFARVAGYFGKPQLQLLRRRRHGETPEVSILESTYKRLEDKPDDMRLVRLSGWHTDDSYFAVPAKATMLQSIQIPDSGGETKFCNMRKAYLDLPEETRNRLDGLRAVHGYDTKRAPARAVKLTKEEEDETPAVDHPLIRTHDETGEKTIYFNSNRTDQIVGMAREESDALLDMIYGHVTLPKYQYHHKWRVGDILLWDNRCMMHAVNMDFPVGQIRLHQRVLLEGARPV
jgi:alpha-ketoglutarate-dependent taurine dioxygenase